MKILSWVLWPSFLAAGVGEVAFFTVFDPQEFYLFGEAVRFSRTAIYSIGFFCFWGLCAGSSLLTCFLQKGPAEINACPLPRTERPNDCPRREE